MNEVDRKCFQQLKKDLSEKLRSAHALIPVDITQWKAKEIALFQEDLLQTVNGRISEKWFYTHIKSEHTSLPRIDILDLLSQYAGSDNWLTYKEALAEPEEKPKKEIVLYVSASIITLVILVVVFANTVDTNYSYRFCLVDRYSKLPVTEQLVDIILLDDKQSPRLLSANEEGCVQIRHSDKKIRLVVRSPYYSIDTIYREYTEGVNDEELELKPNDYARIIHLFSNGNVSEWESRKRDLENMFHDNAKIYQLYGHSNNAMAIYNKKEFITKLILPTGTLRNLEILETVYDGDRISLLRFKKGKK
ncbi:MAG: hypothetical protein WBA74_22115 [Cyclobacteriaceae bacterium]